MQLLSVIFVLVLLAAIIGAGYWTERSAELFRVPMLPEQIVHIPIGGRVVLANAQYRGYRIFAGFPRYDYRFVLLDSAGRAVPYAQTWYDWFFPGRGRGFGVFSVPAPGIYTFRIDGLREADRGMALAFTRPFAELRGVAMILAVMLLILGPVVGDLLLRPTVQLPAQYYGTWEGPGFAIVLTPGRIESRSRSLRYGGPLHGFREGRLSSHFLFMDQTWRVDVPPHQWDGRWYMTVDGVELSRK